MNIVKDDYKSSIVYVRECQAKNTNKEGKKGNKASSSIYCMYRAEWQ
jgi:hypothetical protein